MPDLPKAVAARFFEPAATAQAPDFLPGPAIKERSYSLVVRGLSKKHTCPEALQELADDILRKRFRFFPPCDEFVEKVFYCLHVEGDMAILVFYTELMAELLFQVCRDETSSPFSIAGKRFALERLYTASRQFEEHGNNVVNAVRSLEASSKFVYLSGLPPSWEDGDKLEAHFSGVLSRDLTSKVVGSVHVLPAAAYVEFTDKAAVEKLFYSCKLDGSITSDIDQNLVICCGVRTLPLSREPFQVSEESDVSPASQQCRQRTARNLEERGWEKTGNENSFEQQIREETEKLSTVQQQESPGGLRSKNTKVRDCPSMQRQSSLEQQGRQKGSNLEQQNREEPDKLSSVQQQESPAKTKNTKVRDCPSTEKQRSVRFDLGHAAQGKQQDRVPEARPLARVTSNIDRQVQHMQGLSGAGQRQVAERGLHQVSIMLGGFQKETFDSEQLKKLLVGLFRKHKNYTSEADLKFQVKWDAAADGGRVIFSSEDMANRLMEIYVRATEEFSLDDLKFSLFRPEGYQRPRAAYKTGASSSIYKVLQFDGCRVCPVAERQFRCALAEALETVLLRTSVLEEGKPPFRDVLFREGCCFAILEEQAASALMSSKDRLFVAGRVLRPFQPHAQKTLFIVNLPTETSRYDPTKLRMLLRKGMKKLQPEKSVADCITRISWVGQEPKALVFLQSDADADALMSAYIRFTREFCHKELPLTLHRPPTYIWPGAVYRPKNFTSGTSTCVLNFTGFPLTLDSRALSGAVCELVVRAVLGEGVLEEFQRAVKKFFWKNRTPVAEITVDELVAEKLVAAKGLVLAESNVRFYRRKAPSPGIQVQELARTGTGGWIEEEEEEGEVR